MISSALATMVPIASEKGTTNTRRSAIVITVTASQRRPHSHPCTRSMSGHVATAIMVAQMSAGRKGRKIQNEAAMSPPMNSTARVVRGRSRWMVVMIMAPPPVVVWPDLTTS